jgi:predicted PurR-regulated permease PerM
MLGRSPSENFVDFLRAQSEKRYSLVINDPKPVTRPGSIWAASAQAATIGIFVLLLGAGLYFARSVMLPVTAAVIVGTTLSPLVKRGQRIGIAPAVLALLLVLLFVGVVSLMAMLLADPVGQWIGRAPEIGAAIKQKLFVFDKPLSALHDTMQVIAPSGPNVVQVAPGQSEVVAPVLAFLTPALAQLVIFVGTLMFYLVGQADLRRRIVFLFSEREAKLRFLRITNDIEHNLTGYVGIVTVINVALGVVVGLGAWLFGYPNPVLFGLLATILNYIPYIGATMMALTLFAVGMVSFESLGHALAGPAAFVLLATLEGQFITPTVIGRRITLNPLVIFLALAFWTWLWGPFGAFLAAPLAIIALVIIHHLFPADEGKLPE